MTDHTKLPWITVKVPGFGHKIYTASGEEDAICELFIRRNNLSNTKNWVEDFVDAEANAAFIVKAVNNHDALVNHLHHLATVCCDEDALRLLDSLRDPVSTPPGSGK